MMKIDALIARHARYRPTMPAVVFEDLRLDWKAYGERIERLAAVLRAKGVTKGDRVASVLPNRLELLDLYWACARLGAVIVPLSPLLMPAGLASLLADATPKLVFADAATVPAVAAALAGPDHETEGARRGSLTSSAAWGLSETPRVISIDGATPGFPALADLLAASPAKAPAVAIAPDDPYNIMYTSGTTGMPKGIVHTHRIRAHYATLFANTWRMTPESVVLHCGAIVFNGAMVTLMPAFMQGATYILHRAFDPIAFIDTVERERVTHVMLVPSQIVAILNAPNFAADKLASLQMILSLGAPLHVEHKNRLEAALPDRFYELYGLTEGFVTILDRADAVRKRGSVGVPPAFSEMRIVGEDGRDAGVGEVGEIVGKSPLLMPGYYRRDDLTAQAIRSGWLYTGDLGYVDAEGFLFLVDRKKDMIDSGGVKVYPRDIEEVIVRHPDVVETAVFGVPDEKWGETPVAAVVLRAGSTVDAAALRDWINERVGARYQRVAQVLIRDEFPRNAAGKVLKREMRAPFWDGRETRI